MSELKLDIREIREIARRTADDMGLIIRDLDPQEERILEALFFRTKELGYYPDLFDKQAFIAFYLGCASMKDALTHFRFRGFDGTPTASFRARTFLPVDFGLQTFRIKIKDSKEFVWIPAHYHEEAVRVITAFTDPMTPAIMALYFETEGRRHGIEPLRWTYSPDKSLWYVKLNQPLLLRRESPLKLIAVPHSDIAERLTPSEPKAEDIANAIKGEPWMRDEPTPFGLIFTRDEWKSLDEISKKVKIL